jgi:CheY-like chemotaxis protein/HPt (histidine-containing phosphotransfer) domain-containing protein
MLAVLSGHRIQGAQPELCDSVEAAHAHCSVLVADDVEINRELLCITLEKQGHRVTMAHNGQEAVEQFSNGPFDVIFMDMQMPVLDGYAAVSRIREIEAERNLLRTPIVAMTAYAMQGDREKCLGADMDAYLSKPARAADIVETLNRLVPDRDDCALPIAVDNRFEPGKTIDSIEPAADDSLPIFDRQELVDRLGGREEMMPRFCDMFIKNATGFMELLLAASDSGDIEQIRIQAHSIKGAAGNISAKRMLETASLIETHAREGHIKDIRDLMGQMADDFQSFQNTVSTLPRP